MKFEPQCKTPADLHREWARVLDICEGTEVRPEAGWKYRGILCKVYPSLLDNPEHHEFSIGIVDKKHHVFRGDYLYDKISGVKAMVTNHDRDFSEWSFNPPKQEPIIPEGFTFDHNGQKCITAFNEHPWNPPKQEPSIPKGFTPWHGGEWEGHPRDMVLTILRDGSGGKTPATALPALWEHHEQNYDIIAYKIIEK